MQQKYCSHGRSVELLTGDLAERVHQILDVEVNPAVAAHGGRVDLVDVAEGRVHIRLEGGCQGCSLAEVKSDPIFLDISSANGGMSTNQGGRDESKAPEGKAGE